MTGGVLRGPTVVRNKRLLLKARPRSAASLDGGGAVEAGSPACQSDGGSAAWNNVCAAEL